MKQICQYNPGIMVSAAAMVLLATSALAPTLGAQQPVPRPPLVGTVSPKAVGDPAPVPRPLGGLATTPLGASRPPLTTRTHPRGYIVPLRVVDAPYPRAVGVVPLYDSPASAANAWFPTSERPRWRVDTLSERVDAWRDLIVDDVVCNGSSGACVEREQRVRARWSAYCNCYAFRDAIGRIWRVE